MVYIIQNLEAISLQKVKRRAPSAASHSPSAEQAVPSATGQRMRRRLSFDEAKESTFAQFSETFQRLADAG